jgi:transposase
MNYVGIDHHRQYSHMTLMDEQGNIVRSRKVSNLRSEVEEFLEGVKDCCAVIEAGRSSYTLVDLLDELGVKVTMAHPKEVKSIAKAKVKTDKRDSQMLAHLLRTDLVPEVYQRSKENREVQKILRQRVFYVEAMTRVKNRVHALIAQQREEVRQEAGREKNLFSERGQKVVLGLSLAVTEKKMLASLVKTFRHLRDRLRETTALVEEVYHRSQEAQLIRTVPGFGTFLSVLAATEIADIARFEDAAHLHAYAGVIPSTHSSGERSYHGKITKEGNRWLRWAAVEAVWPGIRADFDLRLFYERLKKRKGANSAKVATARRLLTIIFKMLKENRSYIPHKR